MNPRLWPPLGALLLVVLVALASGLRLTDDLMRLLPSEGELPRAMELLDTFQVADTLLIEVDGTGVERKELLAATDELGERLRQDPDFGVVRFRAETADGIALQEAAAPHAVALIDDAVLAERLSNEGIQRTLQAQLIRLAGPGGAAFEQQFLKDPLDLTTLALKGLREGSAPFDIKLQGGYFLDASGTRALLVVQPAVKIFEIGPDAPFVDKLESELARSALPARWFGGHRMASDAAGMIRDDVQGAALLGTVGLIVLFLLGFRSVRPLVAGALPLSVAAAACFAVAALRSPIHGISLGFAGALLGLAVDYWVHLFCAASTRKGQGFSGRFDAAMDALREIRPGLLLSSGSTGAACLILTTSTYPVVRDLGAMGLGATAGALAGTFLMGPLAFALLGGKPLPGSPFPQLPRASRSALVLGLAGLLLASVTVSFDGDPRNLSPTNPETLQLQDELQDRYGGFGTGGMAVIDGEDALQQAEALQHAVSEIPGLSAVGTANILPGDETVERRQAALPDRTELQDRVDAAAQELGLAPEALEGVADDILARATRPTPEVWADTPLAGLVEAHVSGDSVMVSLVIPDDSLTRATEAAAQASAPDSELVMPSRFAARGVADIASELVRLGGLSLAAILILLALRFRSPRKALAALLPSVASIIAAAGVLALFEVPFNVISSCALVLSVGLGLDYGVFMVEANVADHGRGHTRYAVGMSALTTMTGFGALLTTSTPALFSVGLSALASMGAAGVTALTLSGPLVRGEAIAAPWVRKLGWVGLILVNLDTLVSQLIFLKPPAAQSVPDFTVDGDDRARSFGPNRFLQAEQMRVLYLEGDAYSRGYAHSMLLDQLHYQLEVENLESLERVVPQPFARLAILKSSMIWASGMDNHLRPEDKDEIRGLVDGSTLDPYAAFAPAYTRRVFYHAIHDLGQAWADSSFVVACSGFMGKTPDGDWLLGRNFDFDGGPAFDRDKVIQVVRPEQGNAYVSISFAGMLGVVTGMNEEGLAIAIQAVRTNDPPTPGTPMTLMVREVLQEASTLDEVEAILAERKGFVGENVLVIDADADEAALFELTPKALVRTPVDGQMAVTNHFRSPELGEDPANLHHAEEDTTAPRLARLTELLAEEPLSMERGVEIMTDRRNLGGGELPQGHRHAIDADIATHSAVLNVSTGEIWVSRWPNTAGGYVAVDLDDLLAGELTPHEVIPTGDIQATLDVQRGRELLREARRSDPETREHLARRALALMPDHPEALTEVAVALVEQGRREEAQPYIEAALASPPEYAATRRMLEAL